MRLLSLWGGVRAGSAEAQRKGEREGLAHLVARARFSDTVLCRLCALTQRQCHPSPA